VKKDVVGMDRPASEEVENFFVNRFSSYLDRIRELEERVAYLEKIEDVDMPFVLERVARLEKRVDSTVLCRQELTERVARLERIMWNMHGATEDMEYSLRADTPEPPGEAEPEAREGLPWGDLD